MYISKLTHSVFALSASAALFGCAPMLKKPPTNIGIYYGASATQEQLSDFDLLILHPGWNPDMTLLKPEQTVLAYLTVGEAEKGMLTPQEEAKIGVKRNDAWNSIMVDLRQKEWQDRIVLKDAKAAIDAGFDGFMLDTVDSALHLECSDPVRYAGMKEASIEIIKRLRATYPDSVIMLNRGIEIWQDAAPYMDSVLAESTLTSFDFNTKTAFALDDATRNYYLTKLDQLKQKHPHVARYSVDYWDMKDDEGVKAIYNTQRQRGLVPYVSTPLLNNLFSEPFPQLVRM